MPRIALYPGSFDPPTNGHLSIIQRGLKMFDGLIVAVLRNPAKDAVFSVEERAQLLREAVNGDARVTVKVFQAYRVKVKDDPQWLIIRGEDTLRTMGITSAMRRPVLDVEIRNRGRRDIRIR